MKINKLALTITIIGLIVLIVSIFSPIIIKKMEPKIDLSLDFKGYCNIKFGSDDGFLVRWFLEEPGRCRQVDFIRFIGLLVGIVIIYASLPFFKKDTRGENA
jgi:hypothetical protein